MKVLFVMSDLNGGGAERVVLTISRHLDRKRFAPSLFLLRNEGVYWNEISSDTQVKFGVNGSGRLRYRAFGILHKLLVEASQSDVLVGTLELLPSYFAYLAGMLKRKPVITWVHTDLNRHLPIYGAASMHRRVINALYPRFRRIILPSHSASDSFLRVVPIALSKAQVIYNPIDSGMVQSKAAENPPDWAKAIFEKPTVIALGRLNVAHKGFDLLIRSHAELWSRDVDHNLLILGEGPDRGLLEKLTHDLGVSNSVFLPGFQQNPYPLIKLAYGLVVPSRFEAFGMVVLEAMALGVPVICLISASGPAEILDRGTYGICVSSEDPSSLASAMNEVITDPILRHRYSCLGKERVESFKPEQIVHQWETLIWSMTQSNFR
jgi:glycosyltransferase involved in cell wall biosynthesis